MRPGVIEPYDKTFNVQICADLINSCWKFRRSMRFTNCEFSRSVKALASDHVLIEVKGVKFGNAIALT